MRVGFVFPQWTGAYGLMGYFARRNSTWPPLNLALLAAVIERDGHEAFVVDGQCEGLGPDALVQRVLAQKPDIVGFTATSPFYGIQVEIAERIKKLRPDLPIMMGGPHITITKERSMAPCIDYLFLGEAEGSLPRFLTALESSEDLARVEGVIFRRPDGRLQSTGPAKRVARFDDLPPPARHLLPVQKYRLGTLEGRKKFTSIQTTRGCPWKCIFCASKDLDTTSVLRRSAQSVFEEMRDVVATHGIRHFYIVDDVLTLHREHILELCDLIIKNGLKITFEGSTRANLLDEKMVERLKQAGMIRLSFGLESVNKEIRDIMKKKVPLRHYVDSNQLLNQHGIEVLNSLMIGLPGETRETVRETLGFLARSRDIKQANLAIAVPYPGTEFYEMARVGDHGIVLHTDDFSRYRRYGTAVTTVNGLTPDDLIELQNEGFVSIYSAPWRWRPMYGKHGLMGFALMAFRLARMILARSVKRSRRGLGSEDRPLPAGHIGFPLSPNG